MGTVFSGTALLVCTCIITSWAHMHPCAVALEPGIVSQCLTVCIHGECLCDSCLCFCTKTLRVGLWSVLTFCMLCWHACVVGTVPFRVLLIQKVLPVHDAGCCVSDYCARLRVLCAQFCLPYTCTQILTSYSHGHARSSKSIRFRLNVYS